jgi:cytidine deaminase
MLDETMRPRLIDAARQVRSRAYAPYSNFQVGAAVLTSVGEIFFGCNIENASFGATICAEQVAIFQAIAAGHRHFTALVVIAATLEPVSPCGICRQVLAEFSPDCQMIMANLESEWRAALLQELLPLSFRLPDRTRKRRINNLSAGSLKAAIRLMTNN